MSYLLTRLRASTSGSEPPVQEFANMAMADRPNTTSTSTGVNDAARGKCSSCSKPCRRDQFSPTQWSKGLGQLRCRTCVASSETRQCSHCNEKLARSKFSTTQWNKAPGVSRCKQCVAECASLGMYTQGTRARAYTYTHGYIHVHTYIYTYIRTYICTSMLMYIHTYVHSYLCAFVLMYVRTYVHSYLCT